MNIRIVAFAEDADFRTFLAEAERGVDAMSDEELDAYERELESSIRNLVSPQPKLHLVGSKARKRKMPSVAWPALLIAALALFSIQISESQEETPRWTTKGHSTSAQGLCSILILQPNLGSAELSESAYLVKTTSPVYLKTSCQKGLSIEALENGVWVNEFALEVEGGYLLRSGELLDLRNLMGKNLRIQSQEGLSEEFMLTEVR